MVNESYLINRNINFTITDFREHCNDIDNNILTEETTVFQNAIDYFDKHIINSFNISQKNSFIINDNIIIYINFLFGFSKYLNDLSLNSNQNSCPLQFDIMFIPKNIKNLILDEDITYDDIDFGCSDFKSSNVKYIESWFGNDDNYTSFNSINKIFNKFKTMINELHKKYNDYQMKECRYIFIINRKNTKNIVVYLYKLKNNIISNDGIMHWRTKSNSYYKYLFIVSFHLHSYNKYRLYWHFNNKCIRFFPSMINKLWIKYFICNKNDIKYLNNYNIKNGFEFILYDFEFDKYYRLITGCFNFNNINYKRNIKQLNKYKYDIINIIETSLIDLNHKQFMKIFRNIINEICNINQKTKQRNKKVNLEKCENIVQQFNLNGKTFMKINKSLLKKSCMHANINVSNINKILNKIYKITSVDISKILNEINETTSVELEIDEKEKEKEQINEDDLELNLNTICEYLNKYSNIDKILSNETIINEINDKLIIKLIDDWTVLCRLYHKSEDNRNKIINMYNTQKLNDCYFELNSYSEIIAIINVNSLIKILIMIYEWFEHEWFNSTISYKINIEHEWFNSDERPLYNDLNDEMLSNFSMNSKEINLYKNIKIYCKYLSQSKWNKDFRLCLNELIAIKLYIECDTIKNILNKLFKSNSKMIERRKYFHLSFEIKKALIYCGNGNGNGNENEIGFKIDMISPINCSIESYLILNNNKSFIISEDENDNIDQKITDLINYLITKSTKLNSKKEYYKAIGINKILSLQLNQNKYSVNFSRHLDIFTRSSCKKNLLWFREWRKTKKEWIEYMIKNSNAYNHYDKGIKMCENILSLMKGIKINLINDDDDGDNISIMKKYVFDYNTLYDKYLNEHLNEINNFNALKLTYSVYERLFNEFEFYYLPFAIFIKILYSGNNKKNNLFKYKRDFTIYYDENNMHLLYDVFNQLQCKYNVNYVKISFKFKYRFIPVYDDEYKQQEYKEYNWESIKFSNNYAAKMFLSQMNTKLEIKNFLLPSLNGFIFHKNLIHNKFEYKLFCLLENINNENEINNNEYIEINNGYFNVDMNCIIDEDYEITDYPDSKNDIFEFQTLSITNNSKLTVSPFGNISKNGYLMGYIRIHCHKNMFIDKNCSIDVNGKGYYGDFEQEKGHFGKGKSIEMKKKKSKKKKKNHYDYGEQNIISYFSGGGYGTKGGDCFDNEKNKLLCLGGNIYGKKELDTLYFGSSGGKGGKVNDKSSDRGGGIIELIINNKLTNKGKISSNGRRGQTGGGKYSGGSGGSIKIVCYILNNKGHIEAIGGPTRGDSNHGSGGNGRIAIYNDKKNQDCKNNIQPLKNTYFEKRNNAPRNSKIFNSRPQQNQRIIDHQNNNNPVKKKKKKWFSFK